MREGLMLLAILVAAVRQHSFRRFLVGVRYHDIDIELTLSLCRFLGQDVTRMRMTALYFSGRRQAKSFGRAFMRFELWHYSSLLYELFFLRSNHNEHVHAFELGSYFDDSRFRKVSLEPLQEREAELLMSDLTSAKMDCRLYFVALLQ